MYVPSSVLHPSLICLFFAVFLFFFPLTVNIDFPFSDSLPPIKYYKTLQYQIQVYIYRYLGGEPSLDEPSFDELVVPVDLSSPMHTYSKTEVIYVVSEASCVAKP